MRSLLAPADASVPVRGEGSMVNRTSGRRLRVCFVSVNAYGLLRPKSGLPFGGAEVQMTCLARELSNDPCLDIVVLTGDGDRIGREQEGGMTIVLDGLCGQNQESYRATANEKARNEADAIWHKAATRASAWLDRHPAKMAAAVRSIVRAGYSCRRWLKSLRVLRWLVHRMREWLIVLKWYRLFRSIGADVYVMRCAWIQVGHMQRACALLRRRFVYMVAHEIDITGEHPAPEGIYGYYFRRGMQSADAVVCQHADQLKMLRSRCRRDGHVIRSLCTFPIRTNSDARRRTILWIARLDAWKRPELFVDLAAHMPEYSFVMVGSLSPLDPQNLPWVLERAKELPNLRFLAGVPFDDTTALFEEALVFINTSHAEGFPNTFLQAAACGTPIVSWAVNPEQILDRYRLGFCADQDRDRLERLVRLLCTDVALRVKLGENGRRYVREHHEPAVIARQFADLVSGLVDGHQSLHAAGRNESCPESEEPAGMKRPFLMKEKQ